MAGLTLEEALEKRAEMVPKLEREAALRLKARASSHAVNSFHLRQTLIDSALKDILELALSKKDIDKTMQIIEKLDGFKPPSFTLDPLGGENPEEEITDVSQLVGL